MDLALESKSASIPGSWFYHHSRMRSYSSLLEGLADAMSSLVNLLSAEVLFFGHDLPLLAKARQLGRPLWRPSASSWLSEPKMNGPAHMHNVPGGGPAPASLLEGFGSRKIVD